MQGVLCQLRQLRSLYIGIEYESGKALGTSELLHSIAAGMPHLATLQWHESDELSGITDRAAAFSDDFVTALAEERCSSAGAGGLRLLQASNNDFAHVGPLPPSLQYLAISNGGTPLFNDVPMLLERCSALRELYLLSCQTTDSLPALRDIGLMCPRLRVLVFDMLGAPYQIRSVSGRTPISPQ